MAVGTNAYLITQAFLIPISILIYRALVVNKWEEIELIFLFTSFALWSLCLSLPLPGNNQYKFLLLSIMPTGLCLILSLEKIFYLKPNLLTPSLTLFFLISCSTLLPRLYSFYMGGEAVSNHNYNFVNQGKNINYKINDIYFYIRNNTPKDAIILEKTNLPANRTLLETLSQRRGYIPSLPFDTWSAYQKMIFNSRSKKVDLLYTVRTDRKESLIESIKNDIKGPLYLLLTKKSHKKYLNLYEQFFCY